MTRTAILLGTLAVALATMLSALPAQAQRVFVSGSGSDSNPCTYASPCRTFAQAFTTVAAGGEIDVLDPAGYGALNITHAISIQGHGFAGITQATSGTNAITISAGTSDAITLNGLLIDGEGTGNYGINVNTAGSVQILSCVIRHFSTFGIGFSPTNTPINLLVSDTVASDNGNTGILVGPPAGISANATLNRITANDNSDGVYVSGSTDLLVANSVMSNNSNSGLYNTNTGGSATTWLGTSAISGNATGVNVNGGTVNSYGNNQINGNGTDGTTSLTKISPE